MNDVLNNEIRFVKNGVDGDGDRISWINVKPHIIGRRSSRWVRKVGSN